MLVDVQPPAPALRRAWYQQALTEEWPAPSHLSPSPPGTWSSPGRRGNRTCWPSSTASASTSGPAGTSGRASACGSGTVRTTWSACTACPRRPSPAAWPEVSVRPRACPRAPSPSEAGDASAGAFRRSDGTYCAQGRPRGARETNGLDWSSCSGMDPGVSSSPRQGQEPYYRCFRACGSETSLQCQSYNQNWFCFPSSDWWKDVVNCHWLDNSSNNRWYLLST